MCGIFVYSGVLGNAKKRVWDGLKKLEYRGYDSFGVFEKVGENESLFRFVGKVSGGEGERPG
jgi:glucosamine 6-phosphate synthetase-like amidotransferase/phosphosugar isomerase protein